MSGRFIESTVEEAAIEWLSELGYSYVCGLDISPEGKSSERSAFNQVVLINRLRPALERINSHVPSFYFEEAIKKVTVQQTPSLLVNNHTFHKMLTDGVTVEIAAKDGSGTKHEQIWLIDFENLNNNDWLVVNQLPIVENQNRRPDIIIYVNGLPLAVIELKNAADENATIGKAFYQIQTYKKDIPSLFITNEMSVISDGTQARVGTLTADYSRFMHWRTIDGAELARKGSAELDILLKGIFDKGRFLDIIRYFTVFNIDKKGNIIKKMAGYHQYHAVNKAIERTIQASSMGGDKRAGVIWHTQGSGKSLTMAFYAGKIIQHEKMQNPTFVVLTDRNDLDEQLFGEFSLSHELLRQTPVQAENRKHLQELLKVASGGVVFTTIQKFAPEREEKHYPLISERRNIIVIADEAHRSQYEFIDGFARHIRDGLPNATFIGFTGTPIELSDRSTPAVFGDYIDIYDIQRAVDDEFTVPIFYEARLAKLHLNEKIRREIDEEFDKVTETEEEKMRDRLKSKWARVEAVVGSKSRMIQVASDIVNHFEDRAKTLKGKGMIVCMSRRICVDLYGAIVDLRPEWDHKEDSKGAIKVVMTGSASDPEGFQPHIRNKVRREAIKDRLKDEDDELKLVIVRDMWLTGFDAPPLHTMYLDKLMRGHGLMQAIARVNRVFKDKPGGLIVDYIGIGYYLKEALAIYLENNSKKPVLDKELAIAKMLEKHEVCKAMFHKFEYSKFFSGKATEKMSLIAAAMEHILAQEDGKNRYLLAIMELSKAFALSVPSPESIKIRDDIGFFQVVRAAIMKNTVTTTTPEGDGGKTKEEINSAIRDIVSEAIGSQGIIDIFKAAGLDKPEISPVLSEKFLSGLKAMKQKNLAIEMLRKLINDELRLRLKKNLVQSRQFSDMLNESIRKYQNRTVEAAQVINELIQLARDMREANKRGENLKLSDDELAFYDALGVNDSAVKVLGDATLRQIALELVETIQKNVTIDWTERESVRARLRVNVRKILKKHGYPPDKQEKATQTVLEQAELLAKDWI